MFSANSLKQQSVGRQSTPLGHIPIMSQQIFTLMLNAMCLSREETNTNIIVFGLTWPGLEPKIYHTWDMQANYYTIDAVFKRKSNDLQPTDSIVIDSSQ